LRQPLAPRILSMDSLVTSPLRWPVASATARRRSNLPLPVAPTPLKASENVVVPDNGSLIEIENGEKIKVLKEKAPSNPVMVDGFAVGDMQEVVLRDRQLLAQDGMFVIIASVNSETGKLKKSPDIISRGFVYLRENQELLRQARIIIKKTIEDNASGQQPINFDFLKDAVTDNLSRFLFQKTAKRPLVIPVLLGV
ncbi:MAG: hypothetical protein V4438_01695, partial [Patescibacteria group bacterium]